MTTQKDKPYPVRPRFGTPHNVTLQQKLHMKHKDWRKLTKPEEMYITHSCEAFMNNPYRKESERLRDTIIKRGMAWPLIRWFNPTITIRQRYTPPPGYERLPRPFSLNPKMNGPKRKWFNRSVRRLSTLDELSRRWQYLETAYLATNHPVFRALVSMYVKDRPWEVRELRVEHVCIKRPQQRDETEVISAWLQKFWDLPQTDFNHCGLVANTKERIEMNRLRALNILPQGYVNLMHSAQYGNPNDEWIECYFVCIDVIQGSKIQSSLRGLEQRLWRKLGYREYMMLVEKPRRLK